MTEILARFGLSWARLLWGAVVFALSLGASFAVVVAVLVRLPADHFVTGGRSEQRIAVRVARNLLGVVLVVAGGVMAIPGVPGQGLLTMFIGLLLLDLPGKRALERKVMARPSVLKSVNEIRARFGKPPMIPLSDGTSDPSSALTPSSRDRS